MSNILIVESKNDKIFLEALIKHLNYDIEVDKPICIDDYECLEGLNEKRLTNTLKELQADLQKRDIQKVGIILDIDNFSKEDRISFVNKCLKNVFSQAETLSNTEQLIDIPIDDNYILKLGCYFTNVNEKGELETVLKSIKSQDSTYADCLIAWKNCLEAKGKSITLKEFDKFWLSQYIRYDTCSQEEQKQAGRKCSMNAFEYVMKNKAKIWDFNHLILNDLKDFLNLFVS